jgi:hypothetical protein
MIWSRHPRYLRGAAAVFLSLFDRRVVPNRRGAPQDTAADRPEVASKNDSLSIINGQ